MSRPATVARSLPADAGPVRGTPTAGGGPLAQAREAARALVAAGRPTEAVEYLLAALEAVLRESQRLALQSAAFRRGAGGQSERVDPAQLALVLEELAALGGSSADTALDALHDAHEEAALEREIAAAEERAAHERPARTPRGTWRTAATVQRVVHEVAVPEDERRCPDCQQVQQPLGADVTHRLVYVPGHFEDHEYHRAKYACGTCKSGVTTAAAPAQVLERSAADASLLAHLVVSKYADHCPLTRAQRIYTREGVTIPVSTLADWIAGVSARVRPLVELLAARVLRAGVVRTDATGLQVLDPRNAAHVVSGTMWCLVGDDRDVVFRYTPTGDGASGPWTFLAGRVGYLQADAASVFDRLYNGEVASAVEVGCFAHARRRFVALVETDSRAAYGIQLIARLYRIERLADAQQLSVQARTALREERAPPVLEKLHRWLRTTHEQEPPSTDLAKAVGYMLNQWDALGRFVHDGRLSLDNNLCERQLRDIAIGRRNYLFAGSHTAAHHAAALYSLLRTCAQHGVAPLPYLTDILTKLGAGTHTGRLDELLPDRWQASPSVAAPA